MSIRVCRKQVRGTEVLQVFRKIKTRRFLNAEKMHKSAIIHLKANCQKRRYLPFLNNFSVKSEERFCDNRM